MSDLNIMIVGVGGQGTLMASRLLGNVAMQLGYDVKVSEVHGMSQRGGSVVTYVKMGKKIYSPIIEKGEADIILAFEKLEALRWIDYLKQGGALILNDQQIDPMPVITGKAIYPESIIERFEDGGIRLFKVNGLQIAEECGNTKAVNVVLIGLLAATTSIDRDIWEKAMEQVIPQKVIEVNRKAFDKGYLLS
ncbi:MAG: indolepyruvate oxidoreductase subunit beta [Clostridiaceae bacterium]|jgi:indolepyruvate ferredoxin oxidoreductase beta subunit|nr:indolepyruvate oxidoreductase subunit beta [Clostridiaceae bacterium]